MKLCRFGKREFLCDPEATRCAYEAIKSGASEECGCDECRNFATARGHAYSSDFLLLLRRLGIDFRREAEVYWQGPAGAGRHLYGGWFHFVGSLETKAHTGNAVAEDFGNVDVERLEKESLVLFGAGGSLVRDAFAGQPVVQLEFEVEIPWVIEAAEPE